MSYDIVIIGAGPAGMMAGWILENEGMDYCILERGKDFWERKNDNKYDVSYGFGGAGLFSDGKLSYAPSATNLWTKLNANKLRHIYLELKKVFGALGITLKDWDDSWVKRKERGADNTKEYDSLYLSLEQRRGILQFFRSKLDGHIVFNSDVKSIETKEKKFYICCEDGKEYESENIIVATGKTSCQPLLNKTVETEKWNFVIEMGVRIEVENQFFLPTKAQCPDYKLIEQIDKETEIRTFCCCKDGRIVESAFDDHISYNGEAEDRTTGMSNIGIVVRCKTADSAYAKEMECCYRKRENKKMTVKEYMDGGIIVGEQVDSQIRQLARRILSGIGSGKVVGPEIEKYGYYPDLDNTLSFRTGIYFAGDGTSLFRGLMAAFISGGYAAQTILELRKKSFETYIKKLKIKESDTEKMQLVFTAQSKAYFYCRDAICQFVFEQGYLPVNPFRVFGYFLDDRVERKLIRRGNNQLLQTCDELWVFGSIADGVLFEIASAIKQRKKIRFFTIGARIEDIKEIDISELVFEPEVHAKQIKKQDLIDFIRDGETYHCPKGYLQLDFFDLFDKTIN